MDANKTLMYLRRVVGRDVAGLIMPRLFLTPEESVIRAEEREKVEAERIRKKAEAKACRKKDREMREERERKEREMWRYAVRVPSVHAVIKHN